MSKTLSQQQAHKKIQQLRQQLRTWAHAYYQKNTSLVSDAVFDANLRDLIQLEKAWPNFDDPQSPSKTIGTPITITTNSFQPYRHHFPMYSLNNALSFGELMNFDARVKKTLGKNKIDYVCELKIDGVSLNCYFKQGKFTIGATRGDGQTGEDITRNIKLITKVPLVLQQMVNCEVHGEVFFLKKKFHQLNQMRDRLQKTAFANSRNAAAGMLRTLDQTLTRHCLNAFFYDAIPQSDQKLVFHSQQERLTWLKQQGFSTNSHTAYCRNITEVWAFIQKWTQRRESLNYYIDGIVVKVNQNIYREQLAYTAKAPRWAIAYKFPAPTAETKLLNIVPTVGRTGKITYNARLQPVLLAGTTVANATLHNSQFIFSKDIRVGDIVVIKKAGDIIPEVTTVLLANRPPHTHKWVPAKHCPSCNTVLAQSDALVDQYCKNDTCPEQKIRRIVFFASKDALNIKGLNYQTVKKIYQPGLIRDSFDLYCLFDKRDQLLQIRNWQHKTVDHILTNIAASKKTTPARLLTGLGIIHIGKNTAKILLQHFTLTRLSTASVEDLLQIHGIGVKTAQQLHDFFQKNNFMQQITTIGFQFPIDRAFFTAVTNKKFLFTGILTKKRGYYQQIIEKNGGLVMSSFTKTLDYLVVGSKPGKKITLAEQAGVKIISEQALLKILPNSSQKINS